MKDKLEKNAHKKKYYVFKKIIRGSVVSLGTIICALIPVGISYTVNIANAESNNNTTTSYVEGKKTNSDSSKIEDKKESIVEEKDETNLGVKDGKSVQ